MRSRTHSSSVFRAILTTPVRMETLENSTAEKISMRSLNIFWILEARDVSIWDVATDHAAAEEEAAADLLLPPAPPVTLSRSWPRRVLRDESDDRAFLEPSS